MAPEFRKNTIKSNANNLRITPSDRVWDRLERRLEQDQNKVKVSTFRKWMAIAAGMLLFVTSFFLVTLEKVNRTQFVIQDLEALPGAYFASYQFANELNELYEQGTWTNFSEGNRKRLKSTADESLLPPNEDSLKRNQL